MAKVDTRAILDTLQKATPREVDALRGFLATDDTPKVRELLGLLMRKYQTAPQ